MANNKQYYKYLEPWEYYYWGEIPYKNIKKRHKKDANRRQRHIENQNIRNKYIESDDIYEN